MKIEARRIAGFLADPGAVRVVLIHGEDAGLVRERAEALTAAVTAGDPFRLVEIPREQAAKDAGVLAAEAATAALTGGRRLVRVQNATDSLAGAAKEALAGPGPGLVLIEAGELQAKGGLRKLLEAAEAAGVIACYAERGAELAGSIGRSLREMGVIAEPAAVEWLAARLGEDRLVMRRELEKLALYVGPGGRVTEEDAMASLAEGSALDLESALSAAVAGDVALADRALEAAMAEGAHAVQIVRGALRHVQRLHQAAVAVAGGAPVKAAVDGMRPPVFFKVRPAFERALSLWSLPALEQAGAALLEAERRTKTTGLPDETIARSAVLALAREAVRARRG
ncbi:MAG TPA: DNA polymerase III subunit delta [Acetobacteraceae bacterium]|nr:DNA polymerase III subunit delta [Acetobacteraceae bacterium]